MNTVHIILFYKFIDIDDPGSFASSHREVCADAGLLGKVLVADEGINGSLSGSREQIETYKNYLTGTEGFSDVTFKEETASFHPFKKLVVRVKKEIIRFDRKLDMRRRGKYITADELVDLYKSGGDFVILDTRNNYESGVGKFKNAITPDIENFRDFPEALEELEDIKDRKIVTYCTGGIRCEKATAYMVEKGFSDVYQLKDGIINFCQKHPDTVWEGKCFVFDQRLLSDVDPESGAIARCVSCGELCDRYQNCRNTVCDDLIALCGKCAEESSGCCSRECAAEHKQRNTRKARENQGCKYNGRRREESQ